MSAESAKTHACRADVRDVMEESPSQENLLEAILDSHNLREAWKRVKANRFQFIMMIPQDAEVHFTEAVDEFDQSLVISHPDEGIGSFGFCDQNGLGATFIAMGKVMIRAMETRLFWMMTSTGCVAAFIAMFTQRGAQDGREIGELFEQSFSLIDESRIRGFIIHTEALYTASGKWQQKK